MQPPFVVHIAEDCGWYQASNSSLGKKRQQQQQHNICYHRPMLSTLAGARRTLTSGATLPDPGAAVGLFPLPVLVAAALEGLPELPRFHF